MKRFVVLLVSAAVLAPCGFAQTFTGQFRVNTYTTGAQRNCAVSAATGGFVVAWETVDPGGDVDVHLQRFSGPGTPAASELRVNTLTTGDQTDPVLARTSGGFLVVWHGPMTQTGLSPEIIGQRFDTAGVPIAGEFRVNATSGGAQERPAVAVQANGEIVVVWEGLGAGDSSGIFARRFDASGAALTSEFLVNTYTTGIQFYPGVAAGDGFVVVWFGPDSTDVQGIFARRYASNGAPSGNEFRVNTATAPLQNHPAVAMDPDGGAFVVSWIESGYNDIWAQRFAAGGQAAGASFRVNSWTSLEQLYPVAAMDSTGRFEILWESNGQDGSGFAIAGRKFRADGSPVGVEFRVNRTTSSDQRFPCIASVGSGRIAGWESSEDGSDRGIYAQQLTPNGDANGDLVVNVTDVLYLINALFAAGPPPVGDADADGNGTVNVSDVLFLINNLFAGGPQPE